jgi:hypothetical protein
MLHVYNRAYRNIQNFPRNSEPTYSPSTAMFCVVTNILPVGLLTAVASISRGRFHVKWDGLYLCV